LTAENLVQRCIYLRRRTCVCNGLQLYTKICDTPKIYVLRYCTHCTPWFCRKRTVKIYGVPRKWGGGGAALYYWIHYIPKIDSKCAWRLSSFTAESINKQSGFPNRRVRIIFHVTKGKETVI